MPGLERPRHDKHGVNRRHSNVVRDSNSGELSSLAASSFSLCRFYCFYTCRDCAASPGRHYAANPRRGVLLGPRWGLGNPRGATAHFKGGDMQGNAEQG